MAKVYKVGIMFTFEPEGEHADIFEGMTEEEMINNMKNLVSDDIYMCAKYNDIFDSLSFEMIEEDNNGNE
jgi:hypothetical protein